MSNQNIQIMHTNLLRYQNISKERSDSLTFNFSSTLYICHTAYIKVVLNTTSDSKITEENKKLIISQSEKNLVINLVTATEVYFRDLVKAICDNDNNILNNNEIQELLKKPIPLGKALSFVKNNNFTMGELFASNFLFESIENIDDILSGIVGKNFLYSIENVHCPLDPIDTKHFGKGTLCLVDDLPDWKKYIHQMFDMRHNFVHHLSFSTQSLGQDIDKIIDSLIAFITVTQNQYFPKLSK